MQPMISRLAAPAAGLILSACATVGPDFRASDVPQPAGYTMAGDTSTPGLTLTSDTRVAGPWWQVFGSPQLDATVREALANSPSVAEARANLEKAQAQLSATQGAAAPQIAGDAGYQRERINLQAFGFNSLPGGIVLNNPTIDLFSVGATVSYDLDLFGGRRRAVEADRARVDQKAREADAAYLSLTGQVVLEAMRIATLRSQLAAIDEIVAEDQRLLDMVRKAHDAGGEARAAVPGGLAQLADDQALAPPLQKQLTASRHKLALLVGRSPAAWSAPDFDLATLSSAAQIPVSLPSALVRQRPDILAAEAELHAATASIGVAVANQYPDIRLSGAFTQSSVTPADLFKYAVSGWNIGPGVSVPIFNGGRLKAERKVAEAEARAALARYQQTVLRAFVQVSDVLSALGEDQNSIAALQRSVDASAANARNAQNAYRLGGTALVNVITAQRTYSRSRRALLQAQGLRFADLVELYTATAADWRTVS